MGGKDRDEERQRGICNERHSEVERCRGKERQQRDRETAAEGQSQVELQRKTDSQNDKEQRHPDIHRDTETDRTPKRGGQAGAEGSPWTETELPPTHPLTPASGTAQLHERTHPEPGVPEAGEVGASASPPRILHPAHCGTHRLGRGSGGSGGRGVNHTPGADLPAQKQWGAGPTRPDRGRPRHLP